MRALQDKRAACTDRPTPSHPLPELPLPSCPPSTHSPPLCWPGTDLRARQQSRRLLPCRRPDRYEAAFCPRRACLQLECVCVQHSTQQPASRRPAGRRLCACCARQRPPDASLLRLTLPPPRPASASRRAQTGKILGCQATGLVDGVEKRVDVVSMCMQVQFGGTGAAAATGAQLLQQQLLRCCAPAGPAGWREQDGYATPLELAAHSSTLNARPHSTFVYPACRWAAPCLTWRRRSYAMPPSTALPRTSSTWRVRPDGEEDTVQ